MSLAFGTILMLVPILFLSIISVAIIIERSSFFYLFKKNQPKQFACIEKLLSDKNQNEVIKFCECGDSPFLKIAKELFQTHNGNWELVQKKMQAVALIEENKIKGRVGLLGTIAHVAPLLGLLGTVTGNIKAFGLLGEGVQDYFALAPAIGEALYTTAFAMVVSIFAIIFYNRFTRKIENCMATIELDVQRLNQIICRQEK